MNKTSMLTVFRAMLIALVLGATFMLVTASPAEAQEGKTISLTAFDWAMGTGSQEYSTPNSCLSCSFLAYFMIALTDFSFIVFQYFYDFFLVVAPLVLAIWLGWRAAKLMVMGGEDGKDFLYGVVGRLALFACLWIFATGANNNNQYLWQFSGPVYLNYAFSLSDEIRVNAVNGTSIIPGTSQSASSGTGSSIPNTDPIFCNNIDVPALNSSVISGSDIKYGFIAPALKTGCFTERAHALGMATGVALVFDSYGSFKLSWRDLGAWGKFILTVLFKALLGLFVTVVWGISAIWLIFLTLDVVSRGLITAAFSPLLVILYILKPTRNITAQAVKGMAGALVTAVALSVVSVMAFVLVTNVTTVYEVAAPSIAAAYADWDEENEVPSLSASAPSDATGTTSNSRFQQMRRFVAYVGEGDTSAPRIPMDFGTPWFWYLAFCGVAIFALGKKVIKMLEDIVGYSGASEFANSALKSVKMGAVGAMGAAGATAAVGITGAAIATKGAAWAGGGTGNMISRGLASAGRNVTFGRTMAVNKNILKASELGIKQVRRPDGEE